MLIRSQTYKCIFLVRFWEIWGQMYDYFCDHQVSFDRKLSNPTFYEIWYDSTWKSGDQIVHRIPDRTLRNCTFSSSTLKFFVGNFAFWMIVWIYKNKKSTVFISPQIFEIFFNLDHLISHWISDLKLPSVLCDFMVNWKLRDYITLKIYYSTPWTCA